MKFGKPHCISKRAEGTITMWTGYLKQARDDQVANICTPHYILNRTEGVIPMWTGYLKQTWDAQVAGINLQSYKASKFKIKL